MPDFSGWQCLVTAREEQNLLAVEKGHRRLGLVRSVREGVTPWALHGFPKVVARQSVHCIRSRNEWDKWIVPVTGTDMLKQRLLMLDPQVLKLAFYHGISLVG